VQALAIDLRLLSQLRALELRLSPGRALMARVMVPPDTDGRGKLNIAGAAVDAQLPGHVRAGEQLRLVVRSVDDQRVVLELPPGPSVLVPAQPPAAALPGAALPGGGSVRVDPDDQGDGSSSAPGSDARGTHTLALRYDAPALGELDLRFELDSESLRVTVAAPAGEALQLARDHADELQRALAGTGERSVQVTVAPRREPLDLYA
jgi:hypothetical protein